MKAAMSDLAKRVLASPDARKLLKTGALIRFEGKTYRVTIVPRAR